MSAALSLQSWWPKAERLTVGQKRRTQHDCGEGRTLLLSRDDSGYHAWCFRCGLPGFKGPPAESLAEKLERLRKQRQGDDSINRAAANAELPMPAVRSVALWPDKAKLWLYKAGLSNADIGRLGIYYHADGDRVVLPVYDAGVPIFFQARALDGRMPKYLGPTPRPPKLLARWGTADDVTLTEDILSAIKVGMVGEGWAVLGTTVSNWMVASLLKRGCRVNVWTDPDEAGRKAAAKITKQLRAYGLAPRNILSARDPKLHTRSEIQEILK